MLVPVEANFIGVVHTSVVIIAHARFQASDDDIMLCYSADPRTCLVAGTLAVTVFAKHQIVLCCADEDIMSPKQ